METPQLENGYTKIANEILDAIIRYRIPGEERQCLDFILRKTYGYHKKEDQISNSQFVKATGLKKGNVCRALKNLVQKKLVIKSDNKLVPTYRFNKKYKEWAVLSKKITVIKLTTDVIKSDNKVLSKVMDTKDNKETIQKKIYSASADAAGSNGNFLLTRKKRKLQGKRLDTFNRFWEAFDYKKGKAEAADSWYDIPSLTNSLVEQIVAAAEKEALRRIGLIESGKTPKMAQGWLTGRRWEDEDAETEREYIDFGGQS